MLINLKPNERLAMKLEPISAEITKALAIGGIYDTTILLSSELLGWVPRAVFDELCMYLLAHEEHNEPEEPTTTTFSGTEFEIQTEGDEFVMVTVGGTVVGIPTLEAKQLAAWILAQ
jgi:hypothetical protein